MIRPLLAAAVVLTIAAPSWAQHDDPAAEHYAAGRAAFVAHRYAEAAQEFRAAYETGHDPSMLFNLGVVYEDLGDWRRALEAYQQYLRELPEPENRAEVERRIHLLTGLVARDAPSNAPAPAPSTEVCAPAAPPPPPAPERPVAALAVAGGGVALLAAGAIVGVLALTTREDLITQCGSATRCPDTAANADALHALATYSLTSDLLLGAGVLVTAAGALWYLLGAHAPRERAVTVGIAPNALVLTGVF